MRVLLISSDGACGIAEHSAYLQAAVRQADAEIALVPDVAALDPTLFPWEAPYDVVHLNYHAALHSRWHPSDVQDLQADGIKVVITYHDTGVPNSDQCKALADVADAFIVHEPCVDLPASVRYWRQGVPTALSPFQFGLANALGPGGYEFKQSWQQPVVGTVGFPFPWKNYDLLAEASALAGWALVLLAPGATDDDTARWRQINPYSLIYAHFIHRHEVVATLSGCDATAFVYNCHNTGTSGAIRQGIAARQPVIASRFPFGRQFRDLQADTLGRRAITWIEPTLEHLVEALSRVRISPVDAGMVALAEQDSWARLGRKYAALYREVVNG